MDAFWTSSFWRDLNEGEINFRDNLQFELKSDFPVDPGVRKNVFTEEIYLFIPETLHIEERTYLNEFFYMDQLNVIRYKTPNFSFSNLLRPNNLLSPFNRIDGYLEKSEAKKAIYELKLLANIFRSTLRNRVRTLVLQCQRPQTEEMVEDLDKKTTQLTQDIKQFRERFLELKAKAKKNEKVYRDVQHVDEFIVTTIEYYLAGYLDRLKSRELDSETVGILLTECKSYLKENHLLPKPSKDPVFYKEAILHRNSLLTKFVMEALKLITNRLAVQERFGHAIGALAAGIAMTVYMTLFAIALFAYESPPFVLTSFPFILLAVILYILKDRLKESLRVVYQHKAFKWFPDYTTKILNPEEQNIGELKEYFSFVKHKHLSKDILKIRKEQFHDDLPEIKRHESIIKYKRAVTLYRQKTPYDARLFDLNTIFRFNVHRMIEKANNNLLFHLTYDPKAKTLIHEQLPRVYHLNLIIRNTFSDRVEISKFRVVIDKSGIKRVEKL